MMKNLRNGLRGVGGIASAAASLRNFDSNHREGILL